MDHFFNLILMALCAFLLFLSLCFFIFSLLFLMTESSSISMLEAGEAGGSINLTGDIDLAMDNPNGRKFATLLLACVTLEAYLLEVANSLEMNMMMLLGDLRIFLVEKQGQFREIRWFTRRWKLSNWKETLTGGQVCLGTAWGLSSCCHATNLERLSYCGKNISLNSTFGHCSVSF